MNISAKAMEHHKWTWYLMVAVILTIFGLMIYQVVMQEQKVEQYYVTVVLAPAGQDVTGGLPVYPADATGTINAGIQQVRNAVNDLVDATSGVNMKVPHWSKWKLNMMPVIDPTDQTLVSVNYHYTFPVASSILGDTENIMDLVLRDSASITTLFGAASTTRGAWAVAVFDTEVHASLTYGTYSSAGV